jgi:hypothetical protein
MSRPTGNTVPPGGLTMNGTNTTGSTMKMIRCVRSIVPDMKNVDATCDTT